MLLLAAAGLAASAPPPQQAPLAALVSLEDVTTPRPLLAGLRARGTTELGYPEGEGPRPQLPASGPRPGLVSLEDVTGVVQPDTAPWPRPPPRPVHPSQDHHHQHHQYPPWAYCSAPGAYNQYQLQQQQALQQQALQQQALQQQALQQHAALASPPSPAVSTDLRAAPRAQRSKK